MGSQLAESDHDSDVLSDDDADMGLNAMAAQDFNRDLFRDIIERAKREEVNSLEDKAAGKNGAAQADGKKKTKDSDARYRIFVDNLMREQGANIREARCVTLDGQTLLHLLARERPSQAGAPNLRWFIARILARCPDLFWVLDRDGRTPLATAISENNTIFIDRLGKLAEKTLDALRGVKGVELGNEPDGHTTLLHWVMKKYPKDPERQRNVAKVMPPSALSVQDKWGRTPLHVAVETCSAEQLPLVQDLLALGPEALDKFATPPTGTYSVYQYFRMKCSQREEKLSSNSLAPGKAIPSRHNLNIKGGGANNAENEEEKSTHTKFDRVKPAQDDNAPPALSGPPPVRQHGNARTEAAGEDAAATASRLVGIVRRRTGLGLEVMDADHNSPSTNGTRLPTLKTGQETIDRSTRLASELSTPIRQQGQRGALCEVDAFTKIENMLKLAYLQRKQPEAAMEFLTLGPKDKAFWYEFGPASRVTSYEFMENFHYLQLDEFLQYVYFPQVDLDREEAEPLLEGLDSTIKGRTDMLFFFRWLRQEKEVRRILHVVVDDLRDKPHSDETIEECLRDFEVEELDWQKLDLCPSTIRAIGANIKKLHLHWSGNNAALRAWSEPDGLAFVDGLAHVTVHVQHTLDSLSRITKNLEAFKTRLTESIELRDAARASKPQFRRGPVTIRWDFHTDINTPARRGEGGQGGKQSDERPPKQVVSSQEWIKCLEDFVRLFGEIKSTRIPKAKLPSHNEALNATTVAVIDDGVTIPHHESAGKVFSGKSFSVYDDGWRVRPYWSSDTGHGTLMARLIHRVCPKAHIDVIKLQTRVTGGEGGQDRKLQIVEKDAIRAVKEAIDRGADIISMSWTIKKPMSKEDERMWETTFSEAARKKVLLFCSATDRGKVDDVSYPHSCRPADTFRIGAATESRGMWEMVSGKDKVDFALPGKDVLLSGDETVSPSTESGSLGDGANNTHPFEAHTGSSVSTALAAGLAALILECVRIGRIETVAQDAGNGNVVAGVAADNTILRSDLDVIRTKKGMEKAFRSIGTSHQTEDKFINVEELFAEVTRAFIEEPGEAERKACVTSLARHFLGKGSFHSTYMTHK